MESAIQRPQSGHYKHVLEEAAALMESLAENHPFVDGNKRAVVTAVSIFLRLNGYKVAFPDGEAFDFLAHLYKTGTFDFPQLLSWLRDHTHIV